ncbi:sugar phosphate isomerase/epimerase family protein [Brucellaceae bacterium D45D]
MLQIGNRIFGTGIVHGAAYGGKPHDALATTSRFLHDPSIQAVEGSWQCEGEEADKLKNMLAWSGCDVVYAVGGFMRRNGIDPSAHNAEERVAAIEQLKGLVETASSYGARMMLMCSGPDVAPDRRPQAKAYLAEMIGILCAHARTIRPDMPLWITFEHLDRELDQKCLLGPTAETADMIRALRQEHFNLGVTLDLSHVVQLGEDIAQAVRLSADVTIHAHVATCGLDRSVQQTFGDSHCRFDAPGSAVSVDDVALFLRTLVETGYGSRPLATSIPIISVEMKTPLGETPEIVLAHGLRVLNLAAAKADFALKGD